MGADIHAYIERRNPETNKWEELGLYRKDDEEFNQVDFYDGRDYELFSILAGVRGWHEPLVMRRGVPDDMSDTVAKRYYEYRDSWHSATWYDYCELLAYANSNNDNVIEVIDDTGEKYNLLSGFMQCVNFVLNAYHKWYPNPNEVRIIMWFDS